MKTGIFCESPHDEAAIKILVEAVLGTSVEIELPEIQARGVEAVFNLLEPVAKKLYYGTEAIGLIVVVDSDLSPMHLPDHVVKKDLACRLCKIQDKIEKICAKFGPRKVELPFNTAVGLMVPAIEAWYLCGTKNGADKSENFWLNAQKEKKKQPPPYNRYQLKHLAYGTDHPSGKLLLDVAIREATRLAQDISILEQNFPNGFGSLASDLRQWTR